MTKWLRWQGGIPFATFQDGIPPGSSPEGDKIVSGGGNPDPFGDASPELIIWDATTGDKVSELKGHSQLPM